MSKHKKNPAPPVILSDNANEYFNLWIELNNAHEEFEFDQIRAKMNQVWSKMTKQDRRDFHQQSDKADMVKRQTR